MMTRLFTALLLLTTSPFLAAQGYPDPTRFEKDILVFEGRNAAPGGVMALGSSSIGMWKEIKKDLAPLHVVKRGFGGSNMNDAAHFADRLLAAHKPDAVLLYEGDNDIAQGVKPEAILEKFKELAAKIHAVNPEARIYIISIKPSPARWEMWPEMKRTNGLLAALSEKDERLDYIDIATPMLGDDGKPRAELFMEDMLHMKRGGYEIWREAILPVLLEGEGVEAG